MKKIGFLFCLTSLFIFSCETPEDILNNLDHTVPVVRFENDSITVNAGEQVSAGIIIEDESGIDRIVFSYPNWIINEVIEVDDKTIQTYTFTVTFHVPEDALTEWEEDFIYNDGTTIKISQRYHRLKVTAWDNHRNMGSGDLYVKVRE